MTEAKVLRVSLPKNKGMSEYRDLIVECLISLHDKKITQQMFQTELENAIALLRMSELIVTAREVEKAMSHAGTDDYPSERQYIRNHLETALLFLVKEEEQQELS